VVNNHPASVGYASGGTETREKGREKERIQKPEFRSQKGSAGPKPFGLLAPERLRKSGV
jgi:hypothetical protein